MCYWSVYPSAHWLSLNSATGIFVCAKNRKKMKSHEDAAQNGKKKLVQKLHGASFQKKSFGASGSIPCSPALSVDLHNFHSNLNPLVFHYFFDRNSKRRRWKVKLLLASFPGSRVGKEEREPGKHCLHMCQVPLVTCILLRYTFCLPAERQLYCLWDTFGWLWIQKQYCSDVNCLHHFIQDNR